MNSTTARRLSWLPAASLVIASFGCAPKAGPPPPAPPAPAPKNNLVVLLPDAGGKSTSVTVTNPAGEQTLTQPYQAVRVESSGAAPGQPFAMDEPEVRRIFGGVLDTLPPAEVVFKLYFTENSDTLSADSDAQIQAVLDAIRDRHSTSISLIGDTDTTADRQFNYQLGLRRARQVANILRQRGVDPANLFVDSHGDTDLAVKTGPGVAERLNRRVEVTVR